jgi:molybdenum cofactor cytidylyltransferase
LSTAAAVLAAGRGSRLGGDASKPLLDWRGRPLVAWAVDAAVASGLRPVVVVVGYRGDEVRAVISRTSRTSPGNDPVNSEMFADGGVIVVDNPEWEEGIASSLRAALTALDPIAEVDAVAVGLADQPLVGAAAYARLAASEGAAPIRAATYEGRPGNPVVLARSLWPEAMRLRGDSGARTLMRDGAVDRIECGDTGSAADIDTLEDLVRLQQEDQ